MAVFLLKLKWERFTIFPGEMWTPSCYFEKMFFISLADLNILIMVALNVTVSFS